MSHASPPSRARPVRVVLAVLGLVVLGLLLGAGVKALTGRDTGPPAAAPGGSSPTATVPGSAGPSGTLASPSAPTSAASTSGPTAVPTTAAPTVAPPSTLQGAPGPMVPPQVVSADAVGCTRFPGGGVRATFHVVLQGGQNWAVVPRYGPVSAGPGGLWTVVVQDVSGPPSVQLTTVLVGGGSPYRTASLPVAAAPTATCG